MLGFGAAEKAKTEGLDLNDSPASVSPSKECAIVVKIGKGCCLGDLESQ